MRIRIILPLVLLAVSAGLLWSDFYSDYGEKDRQSLAESYYLAGAQYISVGKAELGKEYQALAYKIYPQLSPGQITEEKLPSAQELLSQGLAKVIGAPAQGPGIVPRSFFLRYLGALLDQDPAEVVSFMDGSVYLSAEKNEVTRDEAQTAFADLFASEHLAGLEPSALYDLSSLSITAAPGPVQKRWGESSVLRVHAKMDLSGALAFWTEDQQFFIRKRDKGWYIFAIGPEAPPQDWQPQPVAAPAERPVAVSEQAVNKEIVDAFTGCVAAFLKKNVDGALAFMADEVRIVRMRQTISRDELRTTFLGYFDSADFGGTELSDVVDTGSIFVEPSAELGEGAGEGPVYALNVKARLDLSDKIPFWTTYQRYYFEKKDGDWKIVALF
jgi:hypothetical protein